MSAELGMDKGKKEDNLKKILFKGIWTARNTGNTTMPVGKGTIMGGTLFWLEYYVVNSPLNCMERLGMKGKCDGMVPECPFGHDLVPSC